MLRRNSRWLSMHTFFKDNMKESETKDSTEQAGKYVPKAAFTGGAFSSHMAPLLKQHSEKCGFTSTYWISRAQAQKRNVLMKPNTEPVGVCSDPAGISRISLIHCDVITKDDIRYFFGDHAPSPSLEAQGHIFFHNGKWKGVSDRETVQALQLKRQQYGYSSNRWLEEKELSLLMLEVDPKAYITPAAEGPLTLPKVPIDDGTLSYFFNADQAQNPDALVPKQISDDS